MVDSRLPHRGLVLLGRAFRDRASGVLSLGRGGGALRLVLREGHICAVVFSGDRAPAPPGAPGPDDSAQVRLERVLAEIGIRPPGTRSGPRARRNLRERMLAGLLDTDEGAPAFEPDAPPPAGAIEVAGATEPLILEAIRRMPDPQAVREGLGDIDQRLAPTAGIAEERTLTLTEGYILSHVDGTATARHVLQMVPLEPEETERTLLGLLLTGRLECRPAVPAADEPIVARLEEPIVAKLEEPPAEQEHEDLAEPVAEETPRAHPVEAPVDRSAEEERVGTEEQQTGAMPPADAPAEAPAADANEDVHETAKAENERPVPAEEEAQTANVTAAASPPDANPPAVDAPAAEVPAAAEAAPVTPSAEPAEIDPAVLERRAEVLEFFQSLPSRNHFEVLGVAPGCTDAEVKRAYAALARRYHPDMNRRGGLDDLHDVLEAIFIRVGEAWEVLGDARSRKSYEARFPPGVRQWPAPAAGHAASAPPASPSADEEPEPYFPTDETLTQAQLLLAQARYWDAIQMLESRLPQMPPSKQQRRGRILLARAYAKNPNWLRKAEDALLQVVREDPGNGDAHYELGLLYKAGGMMARAHASFRRVLELRPDHREAAAELGISPAPGRPAGGLLKRLFGGRGRAS